MKQWKCTICGQVFEGDEPPERCLVCGAPASAFVEIRPEQAFRLDSNEKFVIIGGGAAGLSAAKAIRERNHTAQITLICGEGMLPYHRPALSGMLADERAIESAFVEEYDFFIEKRIIPIAYALVERIDRENKQVIMEDGERFDYDLLLIATGANAFNPVKREENSIPVSTLRTDRDARGIIQAAKANRVIIVGGGILGVEAAAALDRRGCQITIFDLGDRLIKMQADERASQLMAGALAARGIDIRYGVSVDRADETGAVLTDGTHLDADFILVSAGVRSEVSLAREAGLPINRGILVDATMCTEDNSIYAAGDCAEFEGRVIGLWSAATDQGAVAGAAMARDPDAHYVPSLISTYFDGLGVRLFTAGRYNGPELELESREQDGVYRALYCEDGKLVGAVYYGQTDGAAETIALIEKRAPLHEALKLIGK